MTSPASTDMSTDHRDPDSKDSGSRDAAIRNTPNSQQESRRAEEAVILQQDQVEHEQRYLDVLFEQREAEIDALAAELAELSGAESTDPGERVSRQARRQANARRRTELLRAGSGLCFGRIDDAHGRLYIGRIGLRATDEHVQRAASEPALAHLTGDEPLLVDWRAPIARTFYTATAAEPLGLLRRRHLRTTGRTVLGVDDEILAGTAAVLEQAGSGADSGLVGEGALIAALDARRTGAMGDIVATLQAEQDEIIRADHHGALVVQGGPGTGKTAVALHRAAYLLFTYPRLAERGVLVVGPSAAFLSYIEQVLPSLGETQVVSATPGSLLPGVTADGPDLPAAAEVKGRAVWADILCRAVAELDPQIDDLVVSYGGQPLRLPAGTVADLLSRARSDARGRHRSRQLFRSAVLDRLAQAVADEGRQMLTDVEEGLEDILLAVDRSLAKDRTVAARRTDVDGMDVDGVATAADLAAIRRGLADDPEVARAIAAIWPLADPRRVLVDLVSDPVRLARLAPELDDADRAAVQRDRVDAAALERTVFSAEDVALLDELADLIGAPAGNGAVAPDISTTPGTDTSTTAGADTSTTAGADTSTTPGWGLSSDEPGALADLAAADRTWTYGHVIVDEAQELSAMQWRMLVRRCPSRSFTVVGDVNQVEAPGGANSWDTALEPVFGSVRRADLTVCYRTPHEVMARTGPVLRAAGSTVPPPDAVRSNGIEPWRRNVSEAGLAAAVATAAGELADRYDGGRVAVIAPVGRCADLESLAVPGQIVVIDPERSKGLEFDAVVIVDPAAIAAQPRGWNALYVAMTRCTQELGILATGDGPAELDWTGR